jgi:predicted nuclease of predicted toxin-antitoxin system
MTAGWRFLVDENLHPQIVTYLRKENIDASYVPDVLFEGADDEADILPYLTDHDRILVTNDLEHFSDRAPGEHEGIVLVYDGKLTAFEIVSGLLDIVETYPDRDALRGYEVLDDWL